LTKDQKILVANLIFEELKLVQAWDGERGESASELFPLIFEKIGDDILFEVLNQVNMENPRKMLVWFGFIDEKYPKTHQLLLKESYQFFEVFDRWSIPKQWEKKGKLK
jgi:hypothetical protein